MATGKVRDDREIHYAVRLGGKGTTKDWPRKTTGVPKNFAKGEVVSDPDRLQQLANEGKVDLSKLMAKGVISGKDWQLSQVN